MNKRCSFRGFSLIELMMSLSLMIVLVGAVVIIFKGISNMITTTEERTFVFQNARAGLNNLVKDLVNTKDAKGEDNILKFAFTINNPTDDTSPHLLMKFLSTTSWIDEDDTTIITSEARIYYYLEKKKGRWTLKRHIVDVTAKDPADNTKLAPDPDPINVPILDPKKISLANDVVCQFIVENRETKAPICQVDYFFFENGQIKIERPETIVFDNADSDLKRKLPIAIRINMDLTDDKSQTRRTFSKVVQLLPTQD